MKIILDMMDFHVLVIYPGTQRFSLASQVEIVPLQAISKGVSLLDGF